MKMVHNGELAYNMLGPGYPLLRSVAQIDGRKYELLEAQ